MNSYYNESMTYFVIEYISKYFFSGLVLKPILKRLKKTSKYFPPFPNLLFVKTLQQILKCSLSFLLISLQDNFFVALESEYIQFHQSMPALLSAMKERYARYVSKQLRPVLLFAREREREREKEREKMKMIRKTIPVWTTKEK